MQRYGFEFEPAAGRFGWFVAQGVTGAAEQVVERIHAEFDLGSDLVFCGLGSWDNAGDRLYLIESGDAADVAREFETGSHAAFYVENVVGGTHEVLKAILAIASLTPILVNPTAYHARFTRHIDEPLAERVLRTMEDHGCHGMDWYCSTFPDFSDADIIGSLVGEQRLHLWWD